MRERRAGQASYRRHLCRSHLVHRGTEAGRQYVARRGGGGQDPLGSAGFAGQPHLDRWSKQRKGPGHAVDAGTGLGQQAERKMAAGPLWRDHGLIFATETSAGAGI